MMEIKLKNISITVIIETMILKGKFTYCTIFNAEHKAYTVYALYVAISGVQRFKNVKVLNAKY